MRFAVAAGLWPAFVCLSVGVLSLSPSRAASAETTPVASPPPPSSPAAAPLPVDDHKSSQLLTLEKRLDSESLFSPTAPKLEPYNFSFSERPPTPEEQQKLKEEEAKIESQRNWLVNAMKEKQARGSKSDPNADYTELYNSALKTLAKTSVGPELNPDGTQVKTKDSAGANKPADPAAAHPVTSTAGSDKPKAPVGEITRFQPTISGLSLDSLKPLVRDSARTGPEPVASFTPAPFETFSLPNPAADPFAAPSTVTNPFTTATDSSMVLSNSSTSVSLPSLAPTLAPAPAPAPALSLSPVRPPDPAHLTVTPPSSIYKPKVADPADWH